MSFFSADFAAIEARVVCFLAGQQDALERFRAYDRAKTKEGKHALDPYRLMATQVYGIPLSQVTSHPHRFVGKGLVLGAGFGLGAPKFRASCLKYRYVLPEGLEFKAIKTWRRTHPKVVQFWYALEGAAKRAIVDKGKVYAAGEHIKFQCRNVEGMDFLLMRLPSGRMISYPKPRIVGDGVTYFGNIPTTQKWTDLRIWGGVWANNSTQGAAADLMAHGAHNTEHAGYETVTLIHDEILSYVKPGQTIEEFVRLLTDMPAWAKGLPIEAEGSLVPFYRKD